MDQNADSDARQIKGSSVPVPPREDGEEHTDTMLLKKTHF